LVLLEVLGVTILVEVAASVIVVTLLDLVALTQLLARLALLLDEQLATCMLLVVVFIKEMVWQLFWTVTSRLINVKCIITNDAIRMNVPWISAFFIYLS
jgi:hypothetical protein